MNKKSGYFCGDSLWDVLISHLFYPGVIIVIHSSAAAGDLTKFIIGQFRIGFFDEFK